MKSASQHNRELFLSARPVLLSEEEQSWTDALVFDDQANARDRMFWGSNVPGSHAPEQVLVGGILAMQTMGYDISEMEKLIEPALKAREEDDRVTLAMLTARVFQLVNTAKKVPDHPYNQYPVYDSFDQVLEEGSFPEPVPVALDSAEMADKFYAAWLAQIVGGAMGTCTEGYSCDVLMDTFGQLKDYPRKPNTYNDDITFELALLAAFEKSGYDLTSEDVALHWVGLIPNAWSAEDIALQNIRMGIFPPESAMRSNPWREWIGAQMRGAMPGMLAPGDAGEAARLAWIDGSVSHVSNGILGEVFNAVMVASAFVCSSVREVLEIGIAAIPPASEYASVLRFAWNACVNSSDWRQAWRLCEEEYADYNWIHAYPNAAAEVVALYFSGESLDTCLELINLMGQDTDCNGAQIATVFGAVYGSACIDAHWSAPFENVLTTYVRGLHETTISGLADRTRNAVKNARSA